MREYFRPNLWPNTPDILPEFLQVGGRAAFMIRLVLAATLGGNYGIYGPAFELWRTRRASAGSEEYLNSEKYEIKHRDRNGAGRFEGVHRPGEPDPAGEPGAAGGPQPALPRDGQPDGSVLQQDDRRSVEYGDRDGEPGHVARAERLGEPGWGSVGSDEKQTVQAHDLLGGGRYLWRGRRVYFELSPESLPAHIIRLRRWVRTEREFDYYL